MSAENVPIKQKLLRDACNLLETNPMYLLGFEGVESRVSLLLKLAQ